MTPVRVVIPARMASTRLPNKPLVDIAGKPMLQHVFERVQKAKVASILIATDSDAVRDAAKAFGADVCMTAPEHESGTLRIAEAVEKANYADNDIVMNVQCDEPLLDPTLLDQLADSFSVDDASMLTTLAEPLTSVDDMFNPHLVKVVCDQAGYAMYFSRAAIPWARDEFSHPPSLPKDIVFVRHIGLYAYRVAQLRKYVALAPSPLESVESLEQLRVLWHSEKIKVLLAKGQCGVGVDTPEDLEVVRALF